MAYTYSTIVLSAALASLMTACGGAGSSDTGTGNEPDNPDMGNNSATATTTADNAAPDDQSELQRELTWLYDKMKTEYLFYQDTPDLDPYQFASAEALLKKMKVSDKDRFSYIQTAEEANNQQNAVSTTFGIHTYSNKGVIKVTRVYSGSSAAEAGIERADTIVRIGDVLVTDEETRDQAIDILRDAEDGDSVELELVREGVPEPFSATLTRREVSRQTVDYAGYNERPDGNRIGYLFLSEFRQKTRVELEGIFDFFQQNNVTSLIIDLRSNSGGRLNIIAQLGSLIIGEQSAGLPFIRFQYSDLGDAIFRNGDFTTGYDLTIEENAAPMQRVHIIASGATCSASEVLVNSLRAYIDVQISGSTTCGKPYGFYGRRFEEKSVLWAINFTSANANGEDEFVDGLNATCEIPDYEVYPYLDTRDPHLASAINYLETGSCQLPQANAKSSMDSRPPANKFQPVWQPEHLDIEHFSSE
ncbi:MAG: S41 family peptidase [Granulosicoccus sp.]